MAMVAVVEVAIATADQGVPREKGLEGGDAPASHEMGKEVVTRVKEVEVVAEGAAVEEEIVWVEELIILGGETLP